MCRAGYTFRIIYALIRHVEKAFGYLCTAARIGSFLVLYFFHGLDSQYTVKSFI